jgi:hypothetical protein
VNHAAGAVYQFQVVLKAEQDATLHLIFLISFKVQQRLERYRELMQALRVQLVLEPAQVRKPFAVDIYSAFQEATFCIHQGCPFQVSLDDQRPLVQAAPSCQYIVITPFLGLLRAGLGIGMD